MPNGEKKAELNIKNKTMKDSRLIEELMDETRTKIKKLKTEYLKLVKHRAVSIIYLNTIKTIDAELEKHKKRLIQLNHIHDLLNDIHTFDSEGVESFTDRELYRIVEWKNESRVRVTEGDKALLDYRIIRKIIKLMKES